MVTALEHERVSARHVEKKYDQYDGEAGEEHTRVGAAEPAEVWEHGARRRRSTVAGLMLLREFPQPA